MATALRSTGHDVVTFPDPMAAWDAFEAARLTEVLVTCVEFEPGRSNGIALARMAHTKRPAIRVLFMALPERGPQMEGLGGAMPLSVTVLEIVESIERLLASPEENSH